jgi:hypothetical protein
MNRKAKEQVEPTRLFDAANAVLEAVQEVERSKGTRCPYPPELMGSADQPQCLVDFTRFEIEEATAFLIRMGYIVVPGAAK